jgi:hypothetical protein
MWTSSAGHAQVPAMCASQPYPEAPLLRDHLALALQCPGCGRTGIAVWQQEPREAEARAPAPAMALLCPGCQSKSA